MGDAWEPAGRLGIFFGGGDTLNRVTQTEHLRVPLVVLVDSAGVLTAWGPSVSGFDSALDRQRAETN